MVVTVKVQFNELKLPHMLEITKTRVDNYKVVETYSRTIARADSDVVEYRANIDCTRDIFDAPNHIQLIESKLQYFRAPASWRTVSTVPYDVPFMIETPSGGAHVTGGGESERRSFYFGPKPPPNHQPAVVWYKRQYRPIFQDKDGRSLYYRLANGTKRLIDRAIVMKRRIYTPTSELWNIDG